MAGVSLAAIIAGAVIGGMTTAVTTASASEEGEPNWGMVGLGAGLGAAGGYAAGPAVGGASGAVGGAPIGGAAGGVGGAGVGSTASSIAAGALGSELGAGLPAGYLAATPAAGAASGFSAGVGSMGGELAGIGEAALSGAQAATPSSLIPGVSNSTLLEAGTRLVGPAMNLAAGSPSVPSAIPPIPPAIHDDPVAARREADREPMSPLEIDRRNKARAATRAAFAEKIKAEEEAQIASLVGIQSAYDDRARYLQPRTAQEAREGIQPGPGRYRFSV